MTYPTAQLTTKTNVLSSGVTYSLGDLLEYSEAGNTGDAITDASLTLFSSQTYRLSGTFVPYGVPSPFYGYVIKGSQDTGSNPAWDSLSAGSLTIPADYAGTSLALSGYLQLHFLNSDANDAFWVVSYSFQYTFSIAAALFTASADSVNFNDLTQAQIDAIGSAPTAIYDALAGSDTITLPNSSTISGLSGVTWNFSSVFQGGAGNDTITGGAGNDKIDGGADNDILDGGAGNDTLSGGNGDDIVQGFVGADHIDGGAGHNFLLLTETSSDLNVASNTNLQNINVVAANAAATIDLRNQSEGFEFFGSSGNDTIYGGAGANLFYGVGTAHSFNGQAWSEGGRNNIIGSSAADSISYPTPGLFHKFTALTFEKLLARQGVNDSFDPNTNYRVKIAPIGSPGNEDTLAWNVDKIIFAGVEVSAQQIEAAAILEWVLDGMKYVFGLLALLPTPGSPAAALAALATHIGKEIVHSTLSGDAARGVFVGTLSAPVTFFSQIFNQMLEGRNVTLPSPVKSALKKFVSSFELQVKQQTSNLYDSIIENASDYFDDQGNATPKLLGEINKCYGDAIDKTDKANPRPVNIDESAPSSLPTIDTLGPVLFQEFGPGPVNLTLSIHNDAPQIIFLSDGADRLVTEHYEGSIFGGSGNDLISFSKNVSSVGLTGVHFYGDGGDDTLIGSRLDDVLNGGVGNDIYVVENAGDKVLEIAGGGTDRVASSISYVLAAGQEIERLDTTGATGTAAINLTGNEFGQGIIGNAGANTLDGKGGADTMQGLGGNDIYIVDNVGDKVLEAVGGGIDRVAASVGYVLAAGQEVERLDTTSAASTTATNLTGNEFGQGIIGNAGANTLDGKGGADTMQGLAGNDIYIVDNVGDKVLEAAGGGVDRVASSVSYVLAAGQVIERLDTTSAAGTAAINLTGNEFVQGIIGNAGANTLDGKGGADTMQGLGGNDIYIIDNAGDKVLEAAGGGVDRVASSVSYVLAAGQEVERLDTTSAAGTTAINLTGNEFGQSIIGNAGANTLDGKGGADTMQGLGGNDTFVFRAGEAQGDKVLDFAGNGAGAGDSIAFEGYGTAAEGASLVQLNATQWQINSADGLIHETLTLSNAAAIHNSDFLFV